MNDQNPRAMKIVPVMVGTAGHVDHGKTALVKLLTGCDTDLLPEEKRRGMSIDLGFAPFKLEGSRMVGIIDVPGHEDFIKNMVAGASSIDVLILVIAADDGIMPQTIEHLKIVSLLGQPKVMAVITKIDLVGPERQKELTETLRIFLADNGFKEAPVILVSNKTQSGIQDVKAAINQLVAQAQEAPVDRRAFRLNIERTFSPLGVGTVVTGIPTSGRCGVGDKLEFFPGRQNTVCRAIQKYSQESADTEAHVCCAITIKDIKASDIERGMTLAAPRVYRETSSAILSLKNVHESLVIKRRQDLRFCCGTSARVVSGLLIGKNTLNPEEAGFMQIHFSSPTVIAAADRFLLRTFSPAATIAGGSVLTINIDQRRKKNYLNLERLAQARKAALENDPFASELIAGCFTIIRDEELPALAQNTGPEMKRMVEEKVRQGLLTPLGTGQWIINDRIPQLEEKLVDVLSRYHKENKLSRGLSVPQLCTALGLDNSCQDGLIDIFTNSPRITVGNGFFSLKSFIPELSAKQQTLREAIIKSVAAADKAAVAYTVLLEQLKATNQEMQILVRLLTDDGFLVMVDNYLITTVVINGYLKKLYGLFEKERIVELGTFRSVTGISRNLAVPILELFDSRGITCREGKGRRLLRKAL